MMDKLYVLFLIACVIYLVKNKLLPRLKKTGQKAIPEKESEVCVVKETPDFRVLSFNTADFTYTDDLAHCVEYELEKSISDLKKEGFHLSGDPFPIVVGSSLLILLNYKRVAVLENEAEG